MIGILKANEQNWTLNVTVYRGDVKCVYTKSTRITSERIATGHIKEDKVNARE